MDGMLEEALTPITASDPRHAFVVAQLGQSLDGRIATVTGASKYLNGRAALAYLHRLRAAVDAVVVGIGTVLADDPALTVRHVAGSNPARVVIDPHGRLPGDARCLARDGALVYVVRAGASACPAGAERIVVACGEDGLAPQDIVAALFRRGLRRILVEGGARTVSRFIESGALDQLHLLLAPVILGSGRPGIEMAPIHDLDQAIRPPTRAYPFEDGDVLFICNLKRQS